MTNQLLQPTLNRNAYRVRENVSIRISISQRVDRRQQRTSVRDAFTLFEVVLALSVITVLFSAVIMGSGLYAQYRSRSLEGIRYAKVISGTLDDLRFDLRACYESDYSPVAAFEVATNSSAEMEAPSELREEVGIEDRVLSFSGDVTAQPIHFVGRPNAMLFLRNGDSARFTEVGGGYETNYGQILWLAPGSDSIRLPTTTALGRVDQRVFQAEDTLKGLKRLAVPSISPNQGALEAGLQAWDKPSENWWNNGDISKAEFRYFDGNSWLSSWDSHLRSGAIPIAVEVTLAYNDGDRLKGLSSGARSGLQVETLRFVIRIPASSVSRIGASVNSQTVVSGNQLSLINEGR